MMEYDLDTCPKCGGVADNGFSRDIPPAPYYCRACMKDEELEALRENIRQQKERAEIMKNNMILIEDQLIHHRAVMEQAAEFIDTLEFADDDTECNNVITALREALKEE